MARYTVVGPDGQEIILEGPEGASDEEILKQAKSLGAPRPKEKTRPIDTFMDIASRVGHGITDAPVGALQTFAHAGNAVGLVDDDVVKKVDAKIQDQEAEYNRKHQVEGTDFARMAGNVIPMIAAAPESLAAAAGIGAFENSLMPVTEGDFAKEKVKQAGSGAIMGPAGYGVGKVVGAVAKPAARAVAERLFPEQGIDRLARTSVQADDIMREAENVTQGMPQDAVDSLRQQILEGLRAGRALDPRELARARDFETLGIDPTKGQITRDPIQFANERNWRATFPELTHRFSTQESAIRRHLEEILGVSNPAGSSAANRLIAEGLNAYDNNLQRQISALYDTARNAEGRHATVNMNGPLNAIEAAIKTYGDEIPKSVASGIRDAARPVFNGAAVNKTANLLEAEDLIKLINANTNDMNPTNYRAMGELRNAVKQAIGSSEADGSPFAMARSMASSRFDTHEALPVLAEIYGKGLNGMNLDRIANRYIVNGSTNEVRLLSEVLRGHPDAWNAARAQLGEHINRAALGENTTGDALTRAAGLSKALRTIGDEKLSAFFSPEEIERLHTVSRVAGNINSVPAHSAVNHSNSAVVGAQMVGEMAKKIPKLNTAMSLLGNLTEGLRKNSLVNEALRAEIRGNRAPNRTTEEAQTLMDLIAQITSQAPGLGGLAGGVYGERR